MFRPAKHFLTMLLTLSSAIGFSQGYQEDCCPRDSCSFLDGLSVDAEVLVWKTSEDNTYWGRNITQTNTDQSNLQNETSEYKRKDFDFDFDVGYRLGIGYQWPCQDWSVDLTWTHFSPNKDTTFHGTFDPNNGNNFDAIKLTQRPLNIGIITADQAKARLKIKFNDVWLITSRTFEFCDCMELIPFAGLDYLQINHHLDIDATASRRGSIRSEFSKMKTKTHFSGPGIIVGLKNKWNVGCGFSLLSRLSGGAAYGKVHTSTTLLASEVNDNLTTNDSENNSFKKQIIAPQLNFALGLNWDYCLCGYHFDLFAEWEYNRYFNQNYLYSASPLIKSPDGDLSFQGLTAGFNIGF